VDRDSDPPVSIVVTAWADPPWYLADMLQRRREIEATYAGRRRTIALARVNALIAQRCN
jgi:hypothetical protein